MNCYDYLLETVSTLSHYSSDSNCFTSHFSIKLESIDEVFNAQAAAKIKNADFYSIIFDTFNDTSDDWLALLFRIFKNSVIDVIFYNLHQLENSKSEIICEAVESVIEKRNSI